MSNNANNESIIKRRKYSIDTTNKDTILEVLNRDCLRHIFSYVSTGDLIRSERVSKQWRDVVIEYFGWNSKRTFMTPRYPEMTLSELVQLLKRRGAAFTSLCVYNSGLYQSHVSSNYLGNSISDHFNSDFCPNLEELKIDALINFNRTLSLTQFLSCRKLKSIFLTAYSAVAADKLFLHGYINDDFSLERLTLISDGSSGEFLAINIRKFKKIKYLAFHDCNNLQINFIINIEQLPNLTSLNFIGCTINKKQIFLKMLSSLTQLQELSLSDYYSSAINGHNEMSQRKLFIEALSKLSLLKFLNLSKNLLVTDDVMKHIANACKFLVSLDISFCPSVGDEGVIAVCRSCENLQELNVSGLPQLSTRGLDALSQAVRLVRLTARGLRSPNLTASLAACLLACPALTYLDASDSNVTPELVDAAVAALQHPRPLVLRLINTRVPSSYNLPEHSLLTVTSRLIFPNINASYNW